MTTAVYPFIIIADAFLSTVSFTVAYQVFKEAALRMHSFRPISAVAARPPCDRRSFSVSKMFDNFTKSHGLTPFNRFVTTRQYE